jgi:predicted RNA-binding protein with TRAM domain
VATPPTTTRPARGAELELTVDALAHGGNGVARLDGYVVFVAGAIPGDRAVEILAPSPDRIAPRADHPGAPWQVLPYERHCSTAGTIGSSAKPSSRPMRRSASPTCSCLTASWRS